MSHMAFHAEAGKALFARMWGTKFPDQEGVLKDTGVQEFAEELWRLLLSVGPIPLDRPIELHNKTNGPAIKIYNDGPLADWHGIRIGDKDGNEVQLGIGLGNEGIVANNLLPHPKASIDPDDIHRFYSQSGGNADTDRDHPKAVEAGNGLFGFLGLLDGTPNYTAPIWVQSFFQTAQYISTDECHTHYQFNFAGDKVNWPTYVPQKRILLAEAAEAIDKGGSGTVDLMEGSPGEETGTGESVEAYNRWFGCIEAGDILAIVCICGDCEIQYEIVAAPQKRSLASGTALEDIPKGGSGTIQISEGDEVEASNPLAAVDEGDTVIIARDLGSGCGGWLIIAAEC